MTNPFAARLAAERSVLKALNEAAASALGELAGLSEPCIDRWVVALANSAEGEESARLRRALLSIGMRLRLCSAASHRGAIDGPTPDLSLVEAELKDVLRTVKALADASRTHRDASTST